ncbi:MAG: hypothetical protein OEN55_05110 [Alphaproteobacteria bacterium]|nr:hypothetical protein [Alphaproteobacteria bacterium]
MVFGWPDPERLPRGLAPERFLRGRFGDWVARPWLDRAAFGSLSRYFPLSRLWAAASLADGDPGRFREEVPLGRATADGWLLEPALEGVRMARRRHRRVDQAWRRRLFSPGPAPSARVLVETELERRAASRVWMASRGLLMPLLAATKPPPVRWSIPAVAELEDLYEPAQKDPAAFYAAPDPLPEIEQSHEVPGPEGREYWLRFASPGRATQDTAWAKVYEPEVPAADAPTLILCHGLAVEVEMWGTGIGTPYALIRSGVRVIAPEAPWHNRRMVPGCWGGESLIATAPRGAPDLFQASLGEIAVLTGWARGQGSPVVALGGTSLGALTSQLAATQARHWPDSLRPDLLYLVATGGSVQQVAVDSELADVFGLDDALAAAGWDDAALAALQPLTDPLGPPVMSPERIVMVLGRADSVTHFDEGRDLAARWGVPSDNLFIREQGHFSIPLGLLHDDAPLRRLGALMKTAG